MKNLPSFKLMSERTAKAVIFTSLGASLMLLIGNYKAVIDITVKVNEIQVKIDTRQQK
jgi:hypothetical protein